MGRVIAIYARENGQGMAFPAPVPAGSNADGNGAAPSAQGPARMPLRDASRGNEGDAGKIVHLVPDDAADGGNDHVGSPVDPDDEPPRPPAGGGSRPSLKRVK